MVREIVWDAACSQPRYSSFTTIDSTLLLPRSKIRTLAHFWIDFEPWAIHSLIRNYPSFERLPYRQLTSTAICGYSPSQYLYPEWRCPWLSARRTRGMAMALESALALAGLEKVCDGCNAACQSSGSPGVSHLVSDSERPRAGPTSQRVCQR